MHAPDDKKLACLRYFVNSICHLIIQIFSKRVELGARQTILNLSPIPLFLMPPLPIPIQSLTCFYYEN